MILVDSSVWIDHLRSNVEALNQALYEGRVIQHPFVTAELALGSLANRQQIIAHLSALQQIEPVGGDELLAFIDSTQLAGAGIGLVDAHLLAAAYAGDHQLWTSDKRLRAQAERLGCAYLLD